jgi:hypothetical protein
VFLECLQIEVPHIDRHRHNLDDRYIFALRACLFLYHFQRDNSGANRIQNYFDLNLSFNFHADDTFIAFGNLWYFWGNVGLIRKKNKFVAFYAVTMGLYMLSFLTLGIATTVTP